MFILRGKINGFTKTIEWDAKYPGGIVASPATLFRLNCLVGEPVYASPTGPSFVGAFEPDYVAYVTILNVFDGNCVPELLKGEEPVIPGFQLRLGSVG